MSAIAPLKWNEETQVLSRGVTTWVFNARQSQLISALMKTPFKNIETEAFEKEYSLTEGAAMLVAVTLPEALKSLGCMLAYRMIDGAIYLWLLDIPAEFNGTVPHWNVFGKQSLQLGA